VPEEHRDEFSTAGRSKIRKSLGAFSEFIFRGPGPGTLVTISFLVNHPERQESSFFKVLQVFISPSAHVCPRSPFPLNLSVILPLVSMVLLDRWGV